MNVDLNTIINIFVALACGCGVPLYRGLAQRLATTQKELNDHKVYAANHYVKNTDLKDHLQKIEEMILRVESKIERRVRVGDQNGRS